MQVGTVVGIALVLTGAATMGAGVHRLRALLEGLRFVSEPARSSLLQLIRTLGALMLFFLVAYVATEVAFVFEWLNAGQVFVGLVFASGAVFVYRGLSIQKRDVGGIVPTEGQLVPICTNCKRIRVREGSPDDIACWRTVETYLAEAHHTELSHGICPECVAKLHPEFYKRWLQKTRRSPEYAATTRSCDPP